MHITNELLASVFADSAAFCGREDVLHAVIYPRLTKAGFSHVCIAREQPLSSNRGGYRAYGDDVAGDFATTQRKPLVVIVFACVVLLMALIIAREFR